jgi:hypothetical protein
MEPVVVAAEAISEYVDLNEWRIAGIQKVVASLDRGEGVPHERVKTATFLCLLLLSANKSGRSKAWLKIKNPKAPAAMRATDGDKPFGFDGSGPIWMQKYASY